MDLSGSRHIAAAPGVVWAALLDAEVLATCIPGCQSLAGSVEDGFEATVTQKVGPVKATFKGTVVLSDIVQGESCKLTGEGKGGAAGFAKGGAHVHLTPDGDGTTLTYEVVAKVGGKLAQLGSRVIDGVARKLADDFFERFQQAIETPDADTDADAPAEDAKPKGWFARKFKR